jgi:hypothetical protein
MDFFQFLNAHNSDKEKNEANKSVQITTVKKDSKQRGSNTFRNENTFESTSTLQKNETSTYKNIRKGDFVKIISVKDSLLNSYKGYIGEVKDYRKDQDYALVFLHCVQTLRIVKFPLEHFIHYNP